VHADVCREHTASVEDIQWSPTEATVRCTFVTCCHAPAASLAQSQLDCRSILANGSTSHRQGNGQAWMMIRICQELRHSRQFLAAAAHDPTFVIVTLT
jgi:hypothetical protein